MAINRMASLGNKLKQVKTAEAHWQLCLQAFEKLGVTGVGYGVIPMQALVHEGSMTEADFFRHTYIPEWERAVGQHQLLDADTTTELLLAGHEEVFWQNNLEDFHATPANKKLYELERDLGLIWGKTLLLSHHSRNPVSSGISLHVSYVKSDAEFHKYWTEHGADLRAISEMLNASMLGQHKDGIVRLTGREKDYLYWAAMGLDRIETARRLGISEHTLDKPIASAKIKLKARNTSQAVAKAILLGLIDL